MSDFYFLFSKISVEMVLFLGAGSALLKTTRMNNFIFTMGLFLQSQILISFGNSNEIFKILFPLFP